MIPTHQANPPAKPAKTNGRDRLIDELIRPPRPRFVGFDWSRTDKLIPKGDAERDRLLGERLQPREEEPS